MKKYSDFDTNGGNPGGILETFWLWETYAGVQQQGERYGHLVPTHVTDTSMWNNSARPGALKTDFCPQTRAAAARRPASERLWERYRGSCRGEGTGPAPEEGRARCEQSRGATALPLPRAPAPHATPRTRPTRAPLPRLPPPPPHRKSARAARSARPPAPPAQHAPRARSRAPPAPSGAGAQVRPGAGRRAPRREEGGKGAGGERESARPDGSEAPAARVALTGKRLATEAGEGPRRGRMRGGRGRVRVPPRERAAQAHRPQGGRCGRGRSVGRGRGGACAGRATRPTHKMAGVERSLGGSVTALCATCCRASPPSQ